MAGVKLESVAAVAGMFGYTLVNNDAPTEDIATLLLWQTLGAISGAVVVAILPPPREEVLGPVKRSIVSALGAHALTPLALYGVGLQQLPLALYGGAFLVALTFMSAIPFIRSGGKALFRKWIADIGEMLSGGRRNG